TNAYHDYHYDIDDQAGFNNYGHYFIGQPSVVYSVPITIGSNADERTTSKYDGYGDFDGATGMLHPADLTISDTPGSGAGRLLDVTDGSASYRLKARAVPECIAPGGGCTAPGAPTNLVLTPSATSIDISFASALEGIATNRFDVRYRDTPITDA